MEFQEWKRNAMTIASMVGMNGYRRGLFIREWISTIGS
jgi:hypothetical protein